MANSLDFSALRDALRRLEEAGIHVTYGVVGLKTHCKIILVVRQDYAGLTRYAHLGPDDMAFLHYRSGAFFCARAMAEAGTEGAFDVLLGAVASYARGGR